MFKKSLVFVLLLGLMSIASFAQVVADSDSERPLTKEEEEKIAKGVESEVSKELKKMGKELYKLKGLEKLRNIQVSSVYFGGRSQLGVSTEEVSKENYAKFGLGSVRGVAVKKVYKDSAAEKAGLKVGDVIVAFNGEKVTSGNKLRRLISEVSPDHKVSLTVIRNGAERNFDATMERHQFMNQGENFILRESIAPRVRVPNVPHIATAPRIRVAPNVRPVIERSFFRSLSSRTIGVSTTSLTKQLGEHFGVGDGKGLLVTNVRNDSPAAKAGIKAGDVIVEVDGKKVSRSFELMKAVGEKKEGEVTIKIVRDKQGRTVKVTPEKRKDGANYFFDDKDFNFVFEGKGNN